MPDSRQYDWVPLSNLKLPYDKNTKELSEEPRFVDGQDIWITPGGKVRKRPGLNNTNISGVTPPDGRVDRLWIYETLENPPKIYLLASVYNIGAGGDWEMFQIRLDHPTPPTVWTSLGATRDLNASTAPHECVVANGLAYIKAYPASGSGEKLGTAVFDGTDATVKWWGLLGPTVAAKTTASAGWPASTNTHTVNFGWRFVYCWKTSTGQLSSRSPLATAPGESSSTGAFSDKRPQLNVQGHVDTTNIPTISIFRTTDGGGTFYHLDDIANTGAGDILYTDENRTGTPGDPKTDFQIDTGNVAPSLVSNDPPPSVVAPLVVGTDTPERTSNIAFFAGRIWYGIGNYLFFSGQEETLNGIPFESFPSGVTGNFIRYRGQIRNLEATDEALYVCTSEGIHWVRGQDRFSLFSKPLFNNINAKNGQQRAIGSHANIVGLLSNNNEVILFRQNQFRQLTLPVGSDIEDLLVSTSIFALDFHSTRDKTWLLLQHIDTADDANNRIWVYDIDEERWNPPWVIPSCAVVSGIYRENDFKDRLFVALWDEGTGTAKHCLLDNDYFQDDLPGGATQFGPTVTTNLFAIPAGNHINLLRREGHTPTLSFLKTERTKFSGDTDPTISYRLDEFSGSFTTAAAQDPPYLQAQRTSYNVKWYPIQQVAHRAQIKIQAASENKNFELQTIGFGFDAEGGT